MCQSPANCPQNCCRNYRDGCLPEFVGRPEARGANRHRFSMLRPLYGLLGLVLKPRRGYTKTGVRAGSEPPQGRRFDASLSAVDAPLDDAFRQSAYRGELRECRL